MMDPSLHMNERPSEDTVDDQHQMILSTYSNLSQDWTPILSGSILITVGMFPITFTCELSS
jgi:hypothetical protein